MPSGPPPSTRRPYLPLLLGPLAACLVAALAGARLQGFGLVGKAMRVVLGVAAGASVNPELVHRLPEMAYSVALVPLFVLVNDGLGYVFFRRLIGYDRPTAFFSAMPGGLLDMIVFGREAAPMSLSLIHATRVLVIVTLAPLLITGLWDLPLANAPGESARAVPPGQLALLAIGGGAGWWIAARMGLFGASILGPLLLTAAMSLTGVIHHRPPAEAILAAQFASGSGSAPPTPERPHPSSGAISCAVSPSAFCSQRSRSPSPKLWRSPGSPRRSRHFCPSPLAGRQRW